MPDVTRQKNCRGGAGQASEPAGAEAHDPGNQLRRAAELIERDAEQECAQAVSPLLFGLLMDYMGIGVIAVSAGLSLSAFAALLLLKARPSSTAPAPA